LSLALAIDKPAVDATLETALVLWECVEVEVEQALAVSLAHREREEVA
jgi:hypothetical protein